MSVGRKLRHYEGDLVVLRGVPYEYYSHLVTREANHKLRMTYHDGVLEIMSPEWIHEKPAHRLDMLVWRLCEELGIPATGGGSTTFRRFGGDVYKGVGKEPDSCYYFFARAEWVARQVRIDLDRGDPPPDLWIEVDNRASSRGKLPVYAALGVPEVWRYRARSHRLVFLRLTDAGSYESVDRSVALPMLTPALVLEAMKAGQGLADTHWLHWLRQWMRETFSTPGA